MREVRFFCLGLVCLALLGYSLQRDGGASFDDPVNVSKNLNRIETQPAVAVDKNNVVHIAWSGQYLKAGAPDGMASDIFYANNKGGRFSAPVKISAPTDWYSREPTIAVDSQGNVHIVFRRSIREATPWCEDDIYYATSKDKFKKPIRIIDGKYDIEKWESVSGPGQPLIHLDNQDHLYLTIYAMGFKKEMNGTDHVLHMNNVLGTWSAPQVAAKNQSVHEVIEEYRSALDRNKRWHIIVGCNFGDYFYTHNRGGTFAKRIRVAPKEHYAMEGDLAVDKSGKAHVVYRGSTPHAKIIYVNNTSGSFRGHRAVCDDLNPYSNPSIAFDKSGFIHITYRRFPAYGGELYYGNNIGGRFKFELIDVISGYWGRGSRYAALGTSSSIHIAYWNWRGGVYDSDTDIFYVRGATETASKTP